MRDDEKSFTDIEIINTFIYSKLLKVKKTNNVDLAVVVLNLSPAVMLNLPPSCFKIADVLSKLHLLFEKQKF